MHTVGIIGAGKIAGLFDTPQKTDFINTHAQAIFNNPRLKIISAVNPNGDLLKKFSEIWQVENTFLSVDEFLRTKPPDVVSICSPDETHFDIACRILRKTEPPKVLFVEKPIVTSAAMLIDLMETAHQSKCLIIVNHKRRLDPAHKQVIEIISSGVIGDILEGVFTYYGGWLHNGIHLMDLIIMLFGDNFIFRDTIEKPYGQANDRCIDTILDYGSFQIRINSFDEKYYQIFEGELRFEKGRILYHDFGNKMALEKPVRNKIGELELKPYKNNLQGLISPFKYSYDAIVKYLDSGDKTALKGNLLEDAKTVMDKVFSLKNK